MQKQKKSVIHKNVEKKRLSTQQILKMWIISPVNAQASAVLKGSFYKNSLKTKGKSCG